MSDAPKDEKKFVPIFNKTTGVASRGKAQAGKALNANKQSDTEPSAPDALLEGSQEHRGSQQGGQGHPIGSSRGSESGDRSNQELDKTSDTSTRSKGSKDITRVSDIIQRFYASSGVPKKITEPALKKLEERTLLAVQRSGLLELAQREDASLARTLNLAFAAFEIHSNRTIKDLLLKFAVDAGREGFDLAMESVDDWLPLTDEERPPIKELFRRYAARTEQIATNKEMPAKDKKKRQAKLRNLLFLSMIWQANQGWAREEEILRFLRAEGLFTTRTHYPTQATEALLKSAYAQASTDFSPLGWLSLQIENTRTRQASDLERLERDVERLTNERDQARQAHSALRREHNALLARVKELEQSLHHEKQNAKTTSVHLEDDKHRLRSQVVKALRSEVPRLEEALIALQRDPPKLHIVSHYVDETLGQLKKILSDTEGE
ncbi:hypothetical protein GCM10022228_00240 [Halomonas cibimaris]|uniref:Uncharacterized protein n=1 Tax=Halomonas cibimaris TaxID=657012 RepID=A0ABP7L5Y1_9GAMM